ncbi:MAG: phosphatase PAP2 family protein [Candidatus Bathyarchaeota archaeon]|nr:phosphatase PAP2 family protein [Candidatus Bathyarchaeota archaeon]
MAVNASVNSWAVTIQTSSFTVIAKGIAVIFDTESLLVVSLAVAAILFALHYRRGSVLLLGAMAGDALLVEVTKTLVHSPRPTNMLVPDTGYSFPSGHATASIVFFGILTYLAWQRWNSSKVRAVTGGLGVAMGVLVGFDRIYLNVHWFSDVVGGYLLGAFWLTFAIAAFHYQRRKNLVKLIRYVVKAWQASGPSPSRGNCFDNLTLLQLGEEEIVSVLGHEFGHLRGRDPLWLYAFRRFSIFSGST